MLEDNKYSVLETLKQFNINTGHLNPNVIKAWQDTDCEKTQYFFKWFCTALKKHENYVTPLEKLEFEQLDTVLSGDELAQKVENYSEVFDYENNLFEVNIAEEYAEILQERNDSLDKEILLNREMEQRLKNEIKRCVAEEVASEQEKEKALKKCSDLSNELDELNSQSCNQVNKISEHVNLFHNEQLLLSNDDILNLENDYLKFCGLLKNDLDPEKLLNCSNGSKVFQELKERISSSKFWMILSNANIYSMNRLINLLNDKQLYLCDDFEVDQSEQLEGYQQMLKLSCEKYADNLIQPEKNKSDQTKMKLVESKLELLKKIQSNFNSIFLHLCLHHILQSIDVQKFENLEKHLKWLKNYTLNDLALVSFQIDEMQQQHEDFEEFNKQTTVQKVKVLQTIAKLLDGDENTSLEEIDAKISKMKNKNSNCENRHFKYKTVIRPQFTLENIEKMRNFLLSGPTTKTTLINPRILAHLKQVEISVHEQNQAIKLATSIFKEAVAKRKADQLLKYKTELWIYFLTDPQKFLAIYEQIKH